MSRSSCCWVLTPPSCPWSTVLFSRIKTLISSADNRCIRVRSRPRLSTETVYPNGNHFLGRGIVDWVCALVFTKQKKREKREDQCHNVNTLSSKTRPNKTHVCLFNVYIIYPQEAMSEIPGCTGIICLHVDTQTTTRVATLDKGDNWHWLTFPTPTPHHNDSNTEFHTFKKSLKLFGQFFSFI